MHELIVASMVSDLLTSQEASIGAGYLARSPRDREIIDSIIAGAAPRDFFKHFRDLQGIWIDVFDTCHVSPIYDILLPNPCKFLSNPVRF